MKKSVVFGVLSKSPRFGSRITVNTCSTRSVKVNSNAVCSLWQRPTLKSRFTILEQMKCFYRSDFAQRSNESDSDQECSKDFDTDSDIEDSFLQHRHFLYPDSEDPIILKLSECASVQAVFDVVSEHEHEFSGHHASQALLVLWDLQKLYYRINKETNDSSALAFPIKSLVEEYSKKVVSHTDFQKIINCIECTLNELSPDAITCTFLYLKRMGIPFHRSVMQRLLLRIEELLETEGSTFPMSALSRFTVALRESSSMNFASLQKALPLIYEKIYCCESENDIHMLSICFQNVSSLVSPVAFNSYKSKVEELLESDIFPTIDTTVIINIASFFNNSAWFNKSGNLNRKLLLSLKGRISSLKTSDLVKVHKIVGNNLEPADLQAELFERAFHLLSEEEPFTTVENESVELLTCIVSFCSPKKRKALENITHNCFKQELNPQIIASLFKILRSLKTSNMELCDDFWSSTLQVMKEYPNEHSYFNIVKYSNRYMYFNNNLGGTYRHYTFENQLIEWYFNHYETDIIGHIPSKLARMVGFLVAYCDNQEKDFFDKLQVLVTRLDEMSSQLRAQDCIHISRGIQIYSQLGKRVNDKPYIYDIHVQLNSILNRCIKRHTDNLDYSLPVTSSLMRSYVMRRGPQTTDISQSLVDRYKSFSGPVNSRSLREASHNFISSRCLIPETIDRLTEFVTQNGAHVFGGTVELIIFLCFSLGYTPTNLDAFLKVASDVIVRESERMTGLSVLQSSLALCFFHSLPEELVEYIFTIEFLERLDEELANCYAKATYPARVRNLLMQLNRAVCLDYPQLDVPWFHKKYCEEVAATKVIPTSVFYDEVKESLLDILGAKSLMTTHSYTPYGYKLDFEIFFNKNSIPVSWKEKSNKNISRKAIILLKDEVFSNNVKILNGFTQMKKRHLEMLGYEVIEVVETVWNTMYMAEPGMKTNFIRENLFRNKSEAVSSRFV